jgi:hypothetical protein
VNIQLMKKNNAVMGENEAESFIKLHYGRDSLLG